MSARVWTCSRRWGSEVSEKGSLRLNQEPIHLFLPWQLRGLQLRNRIVVSPMCQYSSQDGFANDWHRVHLGSRAVGGAGLVFTEATAVTAQGRISPEDLGLWKDEHIPVLRSIASFIREQGAAAGIQLAHAGRKAATASPWNGNCPLPANEAWPIVAPSAVPFGDGYATPEALTPAGIVEVIEAFAAAARRARAAGFEVLELHAAHGYLLHEFLSPLSNRRQDGYGGSLKNRSRLTGEVVEAVRAVWGEERPLWVRISATDWADGGWTLSDSIELARRLQELGVDVVDCSSGGTVPHPEIPLGPGYQTPFAAAIRRETGMATAALGLITGPKQADHILRTGQADAVVLARAMLREPYWPLRAARELRQPVTWPKQYLGARD